MECVVWATEQAKRRTVDTESDDTDSDDENGAQNEEGSLQQKEKEDPRALSLTDPPVEEAKSGEAEASEEECSTAGTEQSNADEVNDSTSIDVLDELRATLRKSDPKVWDTGRWNTCYKNKSNKERRARTSLKSSTSCARHPSEREALAPRLQICCQWPPT